MRVPTKVNIADILSRPNARTAAVMSSFGVVEVPPRLNEQYMQAETWEVLIERWYAHGM